MQQIFITQGVLDTDTCLSSLVSRVVNAVWVIGVLDWVTPTGPVGLTLTHVRTAWYWSSYGNLLSNSGSFLGVLSKAFPITFGVPTIVLCGRRKSLPAATVAVITKHGSTWYIGMAQVPHHRLKISISLSPPQGSYVRDTCLPITLHGGHINEVRCCCCSSQKPSMVQG